MKILFIGDVVGQKSCEFLIGELPKLKRRYDIDVTIVNGENSADGNGITPYSAKLLLGGGADVITTGNHCFKRREMTPFYDESDIVIRPANLGDEIAGKGMCRLDFGKFRLAVINLIGTSYMQPADNPFNCVEKMLEEIDTKNIVVDFHAEATAEKKAMGYFLAGRVSAVLGTHTHVQTADEIVIDGHTGYITDVGMTGVHESVLGIDKDVIIQRLTTYFPQKHVYAEGNPRINGVVLDIDSASGRCLSITRIN